ncbi:MAG: hypothetical protein WDN50_01805 [Bradyrhizobium sp.]
MFPNLSIFENFSLPLYQFRFGGYGWIKRRPLKQAFDGEVRRLSIKMGHESNLITSLSGGNQQKVLIGRALAMEPKIVVPRRSARGVDIATKQELYAQLRKFSIRVELFSIFRAKSRNFSTSLIASWCSEINLCSGPFLLSCFPNTRCWRQCLESQMKQPFIPCEKVSCEREKYFPSLVRAQSVFGHADLAPGISLLVAALRGPQLFTANGMGGAVIVAAPLILAALAVTPIVLAGRGGVDLSVGPLLGFINVTLVKWLVENDYASPVIVIAYVVPRVCSTRL